MSASGSGGRYRPLAERILSRVAGRDVTAGDIVEVYPDLLVMSEVYWNHLVDLMATVGVDRPFDRDRVVIIPDHTTCAAGDGADAEVHRAMSAYSEAQSLAHFYPVGRGGIRHQVAVDRGLIAPGAFVVSDEPNMAAFGALGSMNYAIGWDISACFVLGTTWLAVPATINIWLDGRLPEGVSSRDVGLRVIREIGTTGALGCALEFAGPGLELLSVESRMALFALMYLTSAETALAVPDGAVNSYLSTLRYVPESLLDMDSRDGPDARSSQAGFGFDLSDLRPLIAGPNDPTLSQDVAALAGLQITEACLGSCSSGRLEDLRVAAKILAGRQVHPRVRFYVTPISQATYLAASREGLLEVLSEAGAVILQPGCNTCYGYVGVLGDSDVCVTTHSAAYAGRMGSERAQIYLGSVATVAAAAVAGEIVDPTAPDHGLSGRSGRRRIGVVAR